jgi:hypothetical protein
MDVVTGPIGSGVQNMIDLNPFAGVLVGILIVAVIILWRELLAERKRAHDASATLIADKNAQLDEAKEDRKFYERLVDRVEKRRPA